MYRFHQFNSGIYIQGTKKYLQTGKKPEGFSYEIEPPRWHFLDQKTETLLLAERKDHQTEDSKIWATFETAPLWEREVHTTTKNAKKEKSRFPRYIPHSAIHSTLTNGETKNPTVKEVIESKEVTVASWHVITEKTHDPDTIHICLDYRMINTSLQIWLDNKSNTLYIGNSISDLSYHLTQKSALFSVIKRKAPRISKSNVEQYIPIIT